MTTLVKDKIGIVTAVFVNNNEFDVNQTANHSFVVRPSYNSAVTAEEIQEIAKILKADFQSVAFYNNEVSFHFFNK